MGKPTGNSNQLERLLHFLEQPESYPHQAEQVEHIQTHISHVFMAPPFVYKLKKPVNFGFLDYSTLEKRKELCHREVELNRRLCEDIYLGVVGVIPKGEGFELKPDDGSGSAVEYAVKMKELPEQYFLHTYLEDDTLTREHLDRVADKLAEFYNGQQPDEKILKWGRVENIKVNTDENFSQTEQFVGQTIDVNAFKAIQAFTNRYFEQHQDLFEKRIEEKRIVDGHGDLHLEHIHITPEKVRIYDCIEFNERFRYGDLAVDLAFLAMDLDFNGRWREERYFIDQMAEKLDDPDLQQIIDFYKCYRAYVKGKVKSLQSVEEEVSPKDRERAADLASRYFDLSLRYALLGSKPVALVFMGRVGTGKSTLAAYLSEKLSIDRFSSDNIRKRLAGLPLQKRTPASKRETLYSAQMSKKTYDSLLTKAGQHLKQGKSVVLDATFNSKRARQRMMDTLDAGGWAYLFVEVQASDGTIKSRLQARDQQSDVVSDARLEDFEMLAGTYQSPDEIAEDKLITINTERREEHTLEELYFKLIDHNL